MCHVSFASLSDVADRLFGLELDRLCSQRSILPPNTKVGPWTTITETFEINCETGEGQPSLRMMEAKLITLRSTLENVRRML